MWLPPHTSLIAFLNQIVFIVLSALTAFNFVMAAVLGPSYLPIGWKPKNKKHESYLQLCAVCPGTYKAPRAHHCRKCDRCVAKMVSWKLFEVIVSNFYLFQGSSLRLSQQLRRTWKSFAFRLVSFLRSGWMHSCCCRPGVLALCGTLSWLLCVLSAVQQSDS